MLSSDMRFFGKSNIEEKMAEGTSKTGAQKWKGSQTGSHSIKRESRPD